MKPVPHPHPPFQSGAGEIMAGTTKRTRLPIASLSGRHNKESLWVIISPSPYRRLVWDKPAIKLDILCQNPCDTEASDFLLFRVIVLKRVYEPVTYGA